MSRFAVRIDVAAVAVIVVVAFSHVAEAQRDEGRRGRGGRGFPVSAARLATADEVQADLKLSDEQKGKVKEINAELRDKARNAFQGGSGFEELQKLNQEASGKLAEVLDGEQQKRLAGILIQLNGPIAVYEPAVAGELNITDEQKTKLADLRESSMQTLRQAFREMRDQGLSRDEMREKHDKIRADADQKVLAELTPDQQSQLESLKGEPLEIDMSQFRGFGGPGGRGDREGRGDRPRRGEQDADKPGSEDAAGDSGT
jgi:Spy/CpxP family protein refolding chaperone